MPEPRTPPKIALDDIIETAANGALRALAARSRAETEFPHDGYVVGLHVVCGYPRFTGLPGMFATQSKE